MAGAMRAGAPLRDLVRIVARLFYTDEEVIALETLLRADRPLPDTELQNYCNIHYMQLRRILTGLKDDGAVKCHRIKDKALSIEAREKYGEQTWAQDKTTHTTWSIDFKAFPDMVRYRVMKMREKIDAEVRSFEEQRQYVCPKCTKEYGELELATLQRGNSLYCEVCDTELRKRENEELKRKAGWRQKNLLSALEPVLGALRNTEELSIPEFQRHSAHAAMTKEDLQRHMVQKEDDKTWASWNRGILGSRASQGQQDESGMMMPDHQRVVVEINEGKGGEDVRKGSCVDTPSVVRGSNLPPWLVYSDEALGIEQTDEQKEQEWTEIVEASQAVKPMDVQELIEDYKVQLAQGMEEDDEEEEEPMERMEEEWEDEDGIEWEAPVYVASALEIAGLDTHALQALRDVQVPVQGVCVSIARLTNGDMCRMTAEEYERYYRTLVERGVCDSDL